MRVLHVVPSLSPGFGGPSIAAFEMCRELAKQGQDVTIFTTDADVKGRLKIKLNFLFNIDGVKIIYFPVHLLRHYKLSFAMAFALKKHIPSFDVVHIHSLFQFSTAITAYYCRKYHKPYIIRPLGQLDPFLLRRHRIRKYIYLFLMEQKNLKYASIIHFTSEGERRLAKNFIRETENAVIPIGIDIEKFINLPPQGTFRLLHPELQGKTVILFLSRINYKKGLDILVDAFKDLAKKYEKLHLIIAGPDSENYGKQVKRWLRHAGLLDKITFTGLLLGDDKLSVLKDSDIFVLPSYSENFGLAIIEAMISGLPVIISHKVNISTDIIKAGAGLVIKCESKELSQAIEKIINNPKLSTEIIEKAKLLVKDKFSWEIIGRKLIELYHSILSNTKLK